jgi:hypothetical protein
VHNGEKTGKIPANNHAGRLDQAGCCEFTFPWITLEARISALHAFTQLGTTLKFACKATRKQLVGNLSHDQKLYRPIADSLALLQLDFFHHPHNLWSNLDTNIRSIVKTLFPYIAPF